MRPSCSFTACVLAAAALLGSGGCDRRSPAPAPITVPADVSMTAAEYLDLGIPAADREWTGDEWTRAAKGLAEAAAKGKLPRFESPKSGALFARMTSLENLGLAESTSLPVAMRLQNASATLQSMNAALKLYVNAANERKVGGRELAELMAFQLAAIDTMLDLMEAYFSTVPKDDPAYEVKAKGIAQTRGGAATVVGGAITSVNEQSVYLPADRLVFIKALQRSLPGIFPHLTEDTRREIVLRLKALSEDSGLGGLQPEARSLYEAFAGK